MNETVDHPRHYTQGGIPYEEIVEEARTFIQNMGGFEKFAEWGMV